MNALTKIDKLYQNRNQRATELRKHGKQILCYLCSLTPVELITAAGLVPYRITGNVKEPISEADIHMETIVCPYVRSCFDLSVKGAYNFCDGLVIPHACDSISRTYDIWKSELGFSFCHFINVPHLIDKSSQEFFRLELDTFKRALEKHYGKEISIADLNKAIKLHNENRVIMRELYGLRKEDPPLISGIEMTKILLVAMSLPVEECNELLINIIEEIKNRPVSKKIEKIVRILICGTEIDDTALIELVEESGGDVVIDDSCLGSKAYWYDVATNGDPLNNIAERYLTKLNCYRTYKSTGETYEEGLKTRFGHIRNFATDFRVKGVIIYVFRYCDPLGFDVPDLKAFLEKEGLPVLYLEDEYSMSSIARLKVRVQAFLETIA